MPADTIVSDLQPLSWRGLTAPCESAPFDFSHSQAERRYPYVDGAGHDWTGLDPIQFKARLYFVNTVEADSFPANWNRWRDALFDGTAGTLVHPILGEVFARILSGSIELVARNRGGVIVDVTFTNTRDDLDEGLAFETLNVNTEAVAKAVDENLEALDIGLPQTIPPTTSILDAYNQIKGQLFSASLTVSGAINQLEGILQMVSDDVDDLNDHSAWPAQTNISTMFASLHGLDEKQSKTASRPTAKIKVQNDTTLDALADEFGNTIDEISGLNLPLLASPVVEKGTVVRYYK